MSKGLKGEIISEMGDDMVARGPSPSPMTAVESRVPA